MAFWPKFCLKLENKIEISFGNLTKMKFFNFEFFQFLVIIEFFNFEFFNFWSKSSFSISSFSIFGKNRVFQFLVKIEFFNFEFFNFWSKSSFSIFGQNCAQKLFNPKFWIFNDFCLKYSRKFVLLKTIFSRILRSKFNFKKSFSR